MDLLLPVEMTRSRSGGHARRCVVVVLERGSARIIGRPEMPGASGTYSRGTAGLVRVPEAAEAAVHACLVLNTRGHVKGVLTVYDPRRGPVLRAVLRRRKVRRSWGDRAYGWALEAALKALGLDRHVRRINLETGASSVGEDKGREG